MDLFKAKKHIEVNGKKIAYYDINRLDEIGLGKISNLPVSIKILLENLLRNFDDNLVTKDHIENLAKWDSNKIPNKEIPFIPSRVILQDFTGVPAVVDFAALRSAVQRAGGNPVKINPLIPAALIIDHSVQVDYFGTAKSINLNEEKEVERNKERYTLLRWAQKSFDNFKVVPPGRGIVHQINLEYLASVVHLQDFDGELVAFPDTVVGTDSHTTMINGLGVLGWGVGGIEAEAVMLGQPYYMLIPEVVGVKLIGKLQEGITATDLVLTITRMLRKHGVVGKIVEFYGPGLKNLSLPDRATISNMSPEYGATMGFFPVDDETLKYLLMTGRKKELVELIKAYTIKQGLFLSQKNNPFFNEYLEINISEVEPSLAGPKRPQDLIKLRDMKKNFQNSLEKEYNAKEIKEKGTISHGSIVIAAITSCTNTSNPWVLIGAGLLAKNAVKKGLKIKPHVKTSIAPGSRVVTDYLKAAGLLNYLETLGFHIVGYGCTTCIGNSGPLPEKIAEEIKEKNLVVAGVLSGNRNFEGRINLLVKANYLASPLLVVAYAIAGTIDIDLMTEPLGLDLSGIPVYLKDIWPKNEEIQQLIINEVSQELFIKEYASVFEGTKLWQNIDVPKGQIYNWDSNSTYIQEPPFFKDFPLDVPDVKDIISARVLAFLGDSVTTDHISPAGSINPDGSAGQYLISKGVKQENFNSFGSRRGNHEIMIRGTFGNIRIKNKLIPGKEGGWTKFLPENTVMNIFEAAMNYQAKNVPLIIIAGKEYGTGSSRDWAAKGTFLLGIKAVIAESYERIHRSNLVGMGVLPLEFKKGEDPVKLGLNGTEVFDIKGIKDMKPEGELEIIAKNKEGKEIKFNVIIKLFSNIEIEYYKNGGILHTVLRKILKNK
ncbi:MAG: aconitate hydratase AcnA [Candidatus Lokiarchaeota archaeon]|nr:aconitate hydratase AcnA [Candidatus Lokiarchaeota archaeon]